MEKKEFNKAEALRRYRDGEKVTAIAEAMGVTKSEVYSAIREIKRAEEWSDVYCSTKVVSPVEPRKPIKAAESALKESNKVTAPKVEKPAVNTVGADTVAEPAPKKRGRKKKAEEDKPSFDEIKAKCFGEGSHEDKSDAEDIEAYADSPEEWAARCRKSEPAVYCVVLKNGQKLNIDGVAEVDDRMYKVIFKGASGKAVAVSAAELLYYYPKSTERLSGIFSGCFQLSEKI